MGRCRRQTQFSTSFSASSRHRSCISIHDGGGRTSTTRVCKLLFDPPSSLTFYISFISRQKGKNRINGVCLDVVLDEQSSAKTRHHYQPWFVGCYPNGLHKITLSRNGRRLKSDYERAVAEGVFSNLKTICQRMDISICLQA